MATTTATTISKIDQFIRDTSTDSVSATDRLQAISIATQDVMTEMGFDLQNATSVISYLDSVNYYKITSAIPDFTEVIDLRRGEGDNTEMFTFKDSDELAVEVANGIEVPSYAIERKDGDTYLVIIYNSEHQADSLHTCNAYDSNGEWEVDDTNSDATNITTDTNEKKEGAGSVNFDIDVSQSANNKATIANDDINSKDLSDDEDLSSLVFWAYIPDITNFTSITGYWGSSSTVYFSATATTDLNGNTLVTGWNEIKIDWADATETPTVDTSAINYLRFDFNYAAGQTDDTDFRIDDVRMVRPEKLTLHYHSWYVGEDSSGTKLTAFDSTTDVPFYSGQYDYFDNVVAHRAAAILFKEVGLIDDYNVENGEYVKALRDLKKRFPASGRKESNSFKINLKW